ncbi:MAG: TonB-dependent receptor [Cyclobacteriaceae bacterium]
MRISCFVFSLMLFGTVLGQTDGCDQIITGQILDLVTKEALPYATIKLVDKANGAVADENGFFKIESVCKTETHLEVRFIGYKPIVHHHDFHHADPVIYLAPDENQLESVVIENSRYEAIQSISVQKQAVDKLSLVTSSIGDLTERVSGVSMLSTGSNISKPMIHGLHSNRVLVINDGVRHAYQVWGQEHAPEVDPSHVDQIEIVKGAGTVKYGPEALGGVILYKAKRPEFDQSINGSAGSSYQTNGRAISSQLSVGQGYHRFAWNVGGFGIYQGDLKAPDYDLSNTGKREYGASFNTLLHQPKFDLQISGSYLDQELGILRGSLVGNLEDLQRAMGSGIPSPTFLPSYEIQNPKQETEHGMLKSDLSVFLGDHAFTFQYAFQRNLRKEYDVRRGELNERPVINLVLLSNTFDSEWIQPTKGIWSGSVGVQFFSQNSINIPGSNPVNFVPDYEVINSGVFTIQSLDLNRTTIDVGARFDFQSLVAADTIREVTSYSNKVNYANATFTLGAKRIVNENISLFSNIGSAWRSPNVSELYSYGYHHSRIQFGLWRYQFNPNISTPLNSVFDQTDRPVPSEQSVKWVTGLEVNQKKLNGEFIVYVNQIDNYIFLKPYGITTNVAGTFPYFIYDQTTALFLGSDWDIRYSHKQSLYSEMKISYVYAIEQRTEQAFLGIPPFNIQYALDYEKGAWSANVNMRYNSRQWHAPTVINPIDFQNGSLELRPNEIFDFMAPPKSYVLVGSELNYQKNQIDISITVDNLLNSTYRVYMDRLRYFSDAPGRNFTVAVGYKF